VEFELVIFDCQQIIPSALQHDIASRLGLGVEGIQGDKSVLQVQVRKEFCATGISLVLVSTIALPK